MAQQDFTIADVLAWARTKPADEAYDFRKARRCAVAQFGRETGRSDLVGVGDIRDIPVRFASSLWKAAISDPMTFGAFVTRLEALCPETVVTPSEWTRLAAYMADIEATAADVERESAQ